MAAGVDSRYPGSHSVGRGRATGKAAGGGDDAMRIPGAGRDPETRLPETESPGETAKTAAPARGAPASPTSPTSPTSPASAAAASSGSGATPASALGVDALALRRKKLEAAAGRGPAERVAPPAPGADPALRAAFDGIAAPAGPATTQRLDGNVEAFASRWRTLEGAKQSIDTTYFFVDDDIFGYAYLGMLLKKAKEGLSVRVMMDDTGNIGGKGLRGTTRDEDLLQELVSVAPERVRVGIFNPLLTKDPTSIASLASSNHDKLAIADGKVVETGGRNIGSDYFSDPKDRKGVFRDTDIRIESATAARSATLAFEREFEDDDTKKIGPDRFGNWKKHDAELLGAHLMMDAWLKAPPLSEAEKAAIRSGGPAAQKHADEALARALASLPKNGVTREPSRAELERLKKLSKDLVSNPELRGSYGAQPRTFAGEVKVIDRTAATTENGVNETSEALLSLIAGARDSITIHNPYVVMTDKALEALAAAGKRGVKIDIITNSPVSTDSTVTQAFFLQDWPLILAKVPNARILVATGDQKHHAKSFVIDGALTGISTYNADWLSARVNSEEVALTWSEPFARDTLASYKEALADPEHGFVEYRIARDEQGRAIVKNGKPVVVYGPENHCPKEMLEAYEGRIARWSFLRDKLDALAPLRRPKLDPARDPIVVVP